MPHEMLKLTAAHEALLAKYGIAKEHGVTAVALINRARSQKFGDADAPFTAPPDVVAMTAKVGDEVVTLSAGEQEMLRYYGVSLEAGLKAKENKAKYRRQQDLLGRKAAGE